MLNSEVIDQVDTRIVNSIIAFLVLMLGALIVAAFIRSQQKTRKERIKRKARIFYIAVVIYLFVLARIWVEGFGNLLTIFSLVAAGLVVTNKETIMNFVGWMIINWRGLFTEGDYIQIQGYMGYVISIGPMYFKVYETNRLDQHHATGRTLRIPNGILINNPVLTITPETSLMQYQLTFAAPFSKDLPAKVEAAQCIIEEIIGNFYADHMDYQPEALAFKNPIFSKLINLKPTAALKISAEKEKFAIVMVEYYAYPKDSDSLEKAFWSKMLEGGWIQAP